MSSGENKNSVALVLCCVIGILLYVGAYGCLRMTSRIVHYYSVTIPGYHQVWVPGDRRASTTLNAMFYPLRKCEEGYWQLRDELG